MPSANLIRWSGLAAMLAGVLWIVPAIITAFKPRDCIGPECDVMAMRDTSDVAPLSVARPAAHRDGPGGSGDEVPRVARTSKQSQGTPKGDNRPPRVTLPVVGN